MLQAVAAAERKNAANPDTGVHGRPGLVRFLVPAIDSFPEYFASQFGEDIE